MYSRYILNVRYKNSILRRSGLLQTIHRNCSYKYLRVVPFGQGPEPTIELGSTVMTQCELPNNVMNFSKSKLVFDLTLPTASSVAPGTGLTPITNFNWLYANALTLIDRITLTSRAGTILADIPNCGIFGIS